MLLPDDKRKADSVPRSVPADGPPPYDSGSSSSTHNLARPIPPNLTPTNYLRIKRKNASIKGTYVIDPDLQVPEELLSGFSSALAESESSERDQDSEQEESHDERKNLYFECKNSSITADIWLVSGETRGETNGKRAELEVKTKNGSVTVRLDSTTTRPFALRAHSKNGSCSVSIPSSFIGPVTIKTDNSWVSLSNPMKERLMTYSEENGVRICFIGDIRKAGYTGRENWSGSTIDVGSINCKVKLSFIDEAAVKSSGGSGFFRWMFGG